MTNCKSQTSHTYVINLPMRSVGLLSLDKRKPPTKQPEVIGILTSSTPTSL
jgi:hypothetical protein